MLFKQNAKQILDKVWLLSESTESHKQMCVSSSATSLIEDAALAVEGK